MWCHNIIKHIKTIYPMSQKEKLYQSIKDAPRNVRIDDLVKLMESFDFTLKKTKEGYIFPHPKLKGKLLPRVAKPHGREKKVKLPYVLLCLEAIEKLMEGT